MKIILRILLIGGLGLVLLLAGLWFFLGPIVRAGLERGGETALGVPTPVAGVAISPFAGDVRVDGLAVHAPEGFEHPEVLRIGSAHVAVPMSSLRDDPLVVERVAVTDLALVLERRDGVFNYEPLLEHARRMTGPPEERPTPEEPSRTMLFREIAIEGVRLTVDLMPGTLAPQTVSLPHHTIRDLEVGGDADPVGELLSRLLDELVELAMAQGSALLSGELAKEFQAARAQFEARAAQELERVEERAREVLDEAGERVGRELEGVLGGQGEGAVDDAKKKLGGLLGGQKDD